MSAETLTLTILRATPSLNDFRSVHWSIYRKKFAKPWEREVWAELHRIRKGPGPRWRCVELFIQRIASRTIADADNLMGGLKPVLDALTKARVIYDDQASCIASIQIAQSRIGDTDNGPARTIITVRHKVEEPVRLYRPANAFGA